jgi:imidazolonepropionase-like amidohydrolase
LAGFQKEAGVTQMKKSKSYRIIHANIVDTENGSVLADSSVEVRDGKIVSISKDNDAKDLPVFDIHGLYLMPGLINLHTHLFGNGVPKASVSTKGSSQKKLLAFAASPLGLVYLRKTAKRCVKDALLSGVTTLRSVGDMRYADVYVRDRINAGKMVGPRMLVSGPALTCPGGHGDGTIAVACKTKEDYLRVIHENIDHHVDLIKITLTSGVMDALDAKHPGDVRMTQEEVNWVVEEAHKNHLKVASHTECSDGVRMCLIAGMDTIEHGSFFDDDIAERFKDSKSAIITTISPALPSVRLPQSYSHYTDVQIESCKIVADGIIECSKAALAHHVTVGLGTDGACPFAAQSGMWRELCYFHKYVGATNAEALKAATITNARIMNIDDITGSITAGKSADMIVVEKNPLEDLKTLRNPVTVIIQGKAIFHPRPKRNAKMEEMLDTLI